MTQHRLGRNVDIAAPILAIEESTLKGERPCRLLKVGSRHARLVQRDTVVDAMDDGVGQGRVRVLADEEELLGLGRSCVPLERWESTGSVGGVVHVQLRSGRADLGTFDGDGWARELREGGAFGEETVIAPFGVRKETAEAVFDVVHLA